MKLHCFLLILAATLQTAVAFTNTQSCNVATTLLRSSTTDLSTPSLDLTSVEKQVTQLKNSLSKEYASFFDPMEKDFYAPGVEFVDPLSNLQGVDAYKANIDLLASRMWLGKFLFGDTGIVLHKITGGDVSTNNNNEIKISKIVTRWTLRLTAKVLPWSPTARFTGISVYDVGLGGPKGVQLLQQTDYWDSICFKTDGSGEYQQVSPIKAVADLLGQVKPDLDLLAPSVGSELPYQLLRRGDGYQVRRYPSFNGAMIEYTRRDEAFATLGAFIGKNKPMAPAIVSVVGNSKTMTWPLNFALPGQDAAALIGSIGPVETGIDNCSIVTVPEKIVAVASYSDASVEPLVRKIERDLREKCRNNDIEIDSSSDELVFAQFDAIFSMGKRRGEVWIELKDGQHPW